MKDKFAVYDYCETLISSQTANEFTYQYANQHLCLLSRIKANIFINFKIFKRRKKWLLLNLLKGEHRQEIEAFSRCFAEQWLQKHLNKKVFDDLKDKKKQGYKVIIISAGFSTYIDYHNEFINADKVIANDFVYENDVFNGVISTKDCHGKEKVIRLDAIVGLKNIDLENSCFYSDCLSDLPLFEIFGNRFFIKNGEIEKFDFQGDRA